MFEDLIDELQPPARALLQAAAEAGLQPRITSTRRTPTQQARLYRRWQSGLSPYPAAPPGTSAHEFGFAFDMVVTPLEALTDVGYTWTSWGGVWGTERDPVHFEYPGFPEFFRASAPDAGPSYLPAGYSETPWWGQIAGPGGWWTNLLPDWVPTSYPDLLKGAITIEKKLGADAAVDWFWKHFEVKN